MTGTVAIAGLAEPAAPPVDSGLAALVLLARFHGVAVDLGQITQPVRLISLKDDHVSGWQATYAATSLFGGDVRFLLGGSGHNAGVINPPAAGKHGYWINDALPDTADAWLASASRQEGSWWPHWQAWIAGLNGDAARVPEETIILSVLSGTEVKAANCKSNSIALSLSRGTSRGERLLRTAFFSTGISATSAPIASISCPLEFCFASKQLFDLHTDRGAPLKRGAEATIFEMLTSQRIGLRRQRHIFHLRSQHRDLRQVKLNELFHFRSGRRLRADINKQRTGQRLIGAVFDRLA